MSKYIKWELINEFKNKAILFGIIAVVYFLVLIVPYSDNVFSSFLYLAFSFVISMACGASFLYGTSRTMSSYKNQTFLLESMIPLSPKKILLAKYILAIFFDFLFCILFVLGIAIVFSKADVNLLGTFFKFFFNSDFDTKTVILRVFVLTITSTIAFTSLVTLIYIAIKSFFPSGKIQRIIATVAGTFLLYMLSYTTVNIFTNSASDNIDWIYSIIMVVLSIGCYFASAWFIENKLEVYN